MPLGRRLQPQPLTWGHSVVWGAGSPEEARSFDVGSQRLRQQHPGPARAGSVVPGECGSAFRGGSGLGGAGELGSVAGPRACQQV